MCGIITSIAYDKSFDNKKKVWDQYQEQKHRGKDGYGFVAVTPDGIRYARATTEKAIKEELDKLPDTFLLMFHHRIPTSSVNSVNANHPIFIHNKKNLAHKYFLIHNGHISNHAALYDDHHKPMGFKLRTHAAYRYYQGKNDYDTYTDSEALGIELALYIEGKTDHLRTRGGVACFMLQVDQNDVPVRLFFFRNTNPINFYRNNHGCFFSSVGKGEELEADMLYCIDFLNGEVLKKPVVYYSAKETAVTVIKNEQDAIDALEAVGAAIEDHDHKERRARNRSLSTHRQESNRTIVQIHEPDDMETVVGDPEMFGMEEEMQKQTLDEFMRGGMSQEEYAESIVAKRNPLMEDDSHTEQEHKRLQDFISGKLKEMDALDFQLEEKEVEISSARREDPWYMDTLVEELAELREKRQTVRTELRDAKQEILLYESVL